MLGALAILAACGARTPEDHVKALYGAIERGEHDSALKMVHPKLLQLVPESKLRASMVSMQDRMAKCGGVKEVQVDLRPGQGERNGKATIVFKGDCKAQESRVMVGEVAGKWYVAF
ncbi:MAG: hypothetical protein AB7L71_02515 [Vicinamibacterales bacterium]